MSNTDDFAKLALQRARRKARSNPEALARRIEADWRAGGARAIAELEEERAIASGSTVAAHRAGSRRDLEARQREHWRPHARGCRCSIGAASAASSDGCEDLASPSASPYDREAALEARRWLRPSLWAAYVGFVNPRDLEQNPEKHDQAEARAESLIAVQMAYYLESIGDAGWRNFVVVDRVREVYLDAIRKGE